MRRKLRQLTADALNSERRDREFMAFKTEQYRRAFPDKQKLDATGRGILTPPVVRDVEPFKLKVKRDDLDFGAAVGEKAKNDFSHLLGAKKALSNTALFEFDVNKEPSNVAGKRLTDSLKAFQRIRGLKVDGLMNPEGPTVKSLRSVLFRQGHPSNVGEPMILSRSRGLSGQPITLAPDTLRRPIPATIVEHKKIAVENTQPDAPLRSRES